VWWVEGGGWEEGGGGVGGGVYGEDVAERLASAPGVIRRRGEAVDIEVADGGLRLSLDDGTTLLASAVVVAPGNLPPMLPSGWSGLPARPAWRPPWGGEGPWPAPGAQALLLGAGRTPGDGAPSPASPRPRG